MGARGAVFFCKGEWVRPASYCGSWNNGANAQNRVPRKTAALRVSIGIAPPRRLRARTCSSAAFDAALMSSSRTIALESSSRPQRRGAGWRFCLLSASVSALAFESSANQQVHARREAIAASSLRSPSVLRSVQKTSGWRPRGQHGSERATHGVCSSTSSLVTKDVPTFYQTYQEHSIPSKT